MPHRSEKILTRADEEKWHLPHMPHMPHMPHVSRRTMLIGGLVGGGLVVGWSLWPREIVPDFPAAENEREFGLWLKIASSGQITLNMPQSEMGQGVFTLLAQVAANELGADWRTMAIQPVTGTPAFANIVLAREWNEARASEGFGLLEDNADSWAKNLPLVVTGGSSSIRMFAPLVREAAAGARAMLMMAAARRWETEWTRLDTQAGFVVDPSDSSEGRPIPFADLADEAAREKLPDEVPLRKENQNGPGEDVLRLDIPSKLDGTANFAADIRLPNMVFASVRSAPIGARLGDVQRRALDDRPGIAGVHVDDRWYAVAANTWWAADRALDALEPEWSREDVLPDDDTIEKALVDAIGREGYRIAGVGDVASEFADQTRRVFVETGRTRVAVHAPIETRAAAARISAGKAEIWVASQAPEDARARVAATLGLSPDSVNVYPMLAGGSFGRNFDNDVAAMAAKVARTLDRPVSLMLSRREDMRMGHFRPPALARMSAALDIEGRLTALSVKIAIPSFMVETLARIAGGGDKKDARQAAADKRDMLAVEGAIPPYELPNLEIAHYPADIALPTGRFRGNSENVGVFFVENFIDGLARLAGAEPLAYRRGMLAANSRLARCLTRVGEMARWNGGLKADDGSAMGIACASLRGSHVAVIAQVVPGEGGPLVSHLWAAVDAGSLIHPDIARQQIEGGLIFGLGQALGNAVGFEKGRVRQAELSELRIPRYADTPRIDVEFVKSEEEPGGLGEVGVPAVAPAIANALHAFDDKRRWTLPLA